jgi:hypothetical protein
VTFDWSATRWVVRPRKYSLLYWRSKFAKRWGGFRARLWPQIWTFISSPLVAALSLTALDWTGNRWPMVLVGVWLVLRLSQYEAHWRLGDWMIGRKKFRDPLEIFRILGRLQESPPLTALTVRVEPVEGDAMARLVRSSIGLGAGDIRLYLRRRASRSPRAGADRADAQEAGQGGIDMKEVERMFPSMTKRWLWPLQSFERRYHLLDGFPSSTRPSRIKATVSISRLVSGSLAADWHSSSSKSKMQSLQHRPAREEKVLECGWACVGPSRDMVADHKSTVPGMTMPKLSMDSDGQSGADPHSGRRRSDPRLCGDPQRRDFQGGALQGARPGRGHQAGCL